MAKKNSRSMEMNMTPCHQPIKVLMLFTILNRGGAETMVMNYFRHIDREKVIFDFVVHREEEGAYEDEIIALGGKIYRMPPFHPLTFKSYKKKVKSFFDTHPEYQIVHGHCSELGYFFYQEAWHRGVPVIIAHAHNSKALVDKKWIFRTWFKHRMRRYITHPFSCGEASSMWLFGKKIGKQAIYQKNAIDTSIFSFQSKRRAILRNSLQIDEDTLVVGHVGRFEKQKNHHFLIDIFAEICHQNNHCLLLLVGEGELQSSIQQYVCEKGIEKRVKFLGRRDDVPSLLSVFDVFLFPSFMEGMSLSMIEAQCAGLPCIVSDTIPHEVYMTDLISHLCLNDSPIFWAEAVIKAFHTKKDRTIYPQQIENAGYDIKKNAEWLEHFYINCLQEK